MNEWWLPFLLHLHPPRAISPFWFIVSVLTACDNHKYILLRTVPFFSFPESTYFDVGWRSSSLSCFLTTDPSVSQVSPGSFVPWWIKFIICSTQNGSILRTSPRETTPADRNICKDTVWLSGLTGTCEATIGSSVSQTSRTVNLSHAISNKGPYPGSYLEQHFMFFCCFVLCRFWILFFTDFYLKNSSPFGNAHCWLEFFVWSPSW